MTTERSMTRSEYDVTQPGDNLLDEARRATSRLCAIIETWCRIALEEEQAAGDYVMVEDPEQSSDEPPRFVKQAKLTRAENRREARMWWPRFEETIDRATLSIMAIDWDPLRIDPQPVLDGITTFRDIFQKPALKGGHHEPGLHLFLRRGPLYADKKHGSNLRRYEEILNAAMGIVAAFSNKLGVLDGAGIEAKPSRLVDQPHPDPHQVTEMTIGTLVEELSRHESTIRRWCRAAGIPKRTKREPLTRGELELLASHAFRMGHTEGAKNLRKRARA